MGSFDSSGEKPRQAGRYSGGTGATMEDAVVINVPSSIRGVTAEYAYLDGQYGERGEEWTMEGQLLLSGPGGKHYDLFTIKFKDGSRREVYFDISAFFGKF